MRKLDPQLEFLAEGGVDTVQEMGDAELERYGVRPQPKRRNAAAPSPRLEVLVQTTGDPADLEAAGMTVRTVAGDVVTGTIPTDRLDDLAAVESVERVESSRALYPELDLALADTDVTAVHTGPPGRRGAGVVVGIVDTGIDFTHPSFRRADGTSRILSIWDQGLTRGTGETSPAGFGYGVEYSNAQINAALAAANPFATVRHRDPFQHGTHVAGIAAGDGSAPGQGRPAGTFTGVAPEADIIVVANASNGAEGLGTSANTLDAVNYVFQRAAALSRPCVVNMSLGDNLGPHDGTSLLERGLDNLLGAAGRVFVKSAGNAAADGIHAQGTVGTGTTVDVRLNQPAGDTTTNQIDLWYRGTDTFQVSVVDPAGNTVGPVTVGSATTTALPGGNSVRVDHRNNDAVNGDKRVFVTFMRGTAATMATGTWALRLRSVSSPGGGRFDAWIQRSNDVLPRFLAPHESPERTISTPGTAHEIITAASYITRGAGTGGLATTSSRGPTRDGRLTPTIAAPGQMIVSARAHHTDPTPDLDPYLQMGGTSMAAPHVAGVVALMLQRTPTLTAEQARTRLRDSARSDTFTGPVPNTGWGAGKLGAPGAVNGGFGGTLRSVPVTTCPVSVPVTRCPSVITVTCPSVPRITCPPPRSVPITTCPVSVPITRCPSVIRLCPSRPRILCGLIKEPVHPLDPWVLDPRLVDPRLDPRIDPRLGGVGGLGGWAGQGGPGREGDGSPSGEEAADARLWHVGSEAYAEGWADALAATSGDDPAGADGTGSAGGSGQPYAGGRSTDPDTGEGFYDYDESWFEE